MPQPTLASRAGRTDSLNELARFMVSVKAGAELFKEGDDGGDFFVIKEGTVSLSRTRDGQELELERLAVGDCVGEASMLGGGSRAFTARALTDCTLVRIELGTLSAVLKESPGLALGLLRKLAARLLRFERIEPVATPAPSPKREPSAAPKAAAAAPSRKGTSPARTPAAPPAMASDSALPARLRHPKSGRLFALTGSAEAIVGRVDRATGFTPPINFSDLDEGRTIGRQHAMMLCRDGEYFVREDAATRNGTFVNGTRLPVKTEQRLANGDRIRFGLIDVVFERA